MAAMLRTATALGAVAFTTFLVAELISIRSPAPAASSSWNPKAAAEYLDRRADWWIAWPSAVRDHHTFCVSCHTALPYMLARPTLRTALHRPQPCREERRLLDNVTTRVRLWKDVEPFYGEGVGPGKSRQSRGTEAVLNALILANFSFNEDTRLAFLNMWELQQTAGSEKGSWPWIDFGNEPFEAKDSPFYGACLAAVAVGTIPKDDRATQDVQNRVEMLREFLANNYPSQSLLNQAVVLWASTKLPGILTPQQRSAVIDALLNKQQRDGGWNLSSLLWSWKAAGLRPLLKLWFRSEDGLFEHDSDGYATGLIAFALEQAGVPRGDVHLQAALAWLSRNQMAEGRWRGHSLNHRLDSSPMGFFMSDTATAYAVLALTAPLASPGSTVSRARIVGR